MPEKEEKKIEENKTLPKEEKPKNEQPVPKEGQGSGGESNPPNDDDPWKPDHEDFTATRNAKPKL